MNITRVQVCSFNWNQPEGWVSFYIIACISQMQVFYNQQAMHIQWTSSSSSLSIRSFRSCLSVLQVCHIAHSCYQCAAHVHVHVDQLLRWPAAISPFGWVSSRQQIYNLRGSLRLMLLMLLLSVTVSTIFVSQHSIAHIPCVQQNVWKFHSIGSSG